MYTLIAPFSSLSIDSDREEEVVEAGAVKIPKEGEFLLNDKVYMSAAQVVRKRQRTFYDMIETNEYLMAWKRCGLF